LTTLPIALLGANETKDEKIVQMNTNGQNSQLAGDRPVGYLQEWLRSLTKVYQGTTAI